MTKRRREMRFCTVCGRPINSSNTLGICWRTSECRSAASKATRRAQGIGPRKQGRSQCSVNDCTDIVHARGLCELHDHRMKANGDPGTAERRPWNRVAISAGETFGLWTALTEGTHSEATVRCRCACGTERDVNAGSLRSEKTRSCGCGPRRPSARTIPYMAAGTVTGRLTALEDAWWSSEHIRFRCECGTESSRVAASVGSGPVRSCGCMQIRVKHGLSQHPLYPVWAGMIARTSNPDSHNYPAYGGRGIKVCSRWQGSPDGLRNFVADVWPRPEGMTLDRIDVDGDYEPGNVRWATVKEQNANKRSVAALTAERDALLALVAELRTAKAG